MKTLISEKYYLAIKEINNNFDGSVSGNTEDDLLINWNGITEISIANIKSKITEMETAEQEAIDKKASGKQKLLDLGLSEEEVKALIGV